MNGTSRFRPSGMAVIGTMLLLFTWSAANGQDSAPVTYELMADSTYQSGCFPPCACPMLDEQPIEGTFTLADRGFDGMYQTYDFTDVRWTVPLPDTVLQITGSGTYRRGGEFAATHQLQLDLAVGSDPIQRFDSTMVPGGNDFPTIDIVISIHGMYCYDTVIHVVARPITEPPPPNLPRHAQFVLHPGASSVEFSLFAGGTRSNLLGTIQLFLGDPDVPVIALAGMVGLSVDRADLIAPDFEPDSPALPEPLHMIADPYMNSIGSWNTHTGEIAFDLYLTTPVANHLPVPQPVRLAGQLSEGKLEVAGDNDNIPDGTMRLEIVAYEVPLPPPPIDVWFSTENGFGAARIDPSTDNAIVPISDGDLLSRRGHIVRTNHQLTARLGIMPIVPDLGLDAVVPGPHGSIWFSFEPQNTPIWSETLGVWLKHGDLLSDRGFVLQSNEDLLARFVRIPPVADVGLDAVTHAPNRAILFSTEESFFCESLGQMVSHGDLLCNRGNVILTNQQLLQNFNILDSTMQPTPVDYGLDAIVLRPFREIWFSTEIGFQDNELGWISDGDLLSTQGYVVAGNLDLVAPFEPVEDVDNFGLDAVNVVVPSLVADFDHDGDVDQSDFGQFQTSVSGPNVLSLEADIGDFDGDGDVDLSDFGVFQRCMSGPNVPANPDCAE